ncbi:hypothetical protein ACEQ8H_006965 [Pleosporales sp. CAS-2024a]
MSNSDEDSAGARQRLLEQSTEMADLGQARFDHETAEVTDRDAALWVEQPVHVRQGRAPKGLEDKAFAWQTFKYTTEDRNEKEELKGELHEGQLHRQNRAAREAEMQAAQGGRAARARRQEPDDNKADALCAGRKQGHGPPLAKGFAEELTKDMFWEGPLA